MSKRRAVHFRLGALLILFAIVSLAMGTSSGFAADSPLSLHPKASLLPFTHQGPFVTTGDGGVLCVDAQNALHSRDEGRTWTSVPIFRNATKFKTRDERALLRTHDGTVIAAWMNEVEKKSPPGWNWGKSNVDCRMFVLPIYVCRSLDDGKTWEEPVKLNDPWCGCIHSMIETRSGRIVLVGQEVIPAWRHATVMFISDDKGKTWQRSNVLDIGVGRHDHAGSIEGTVVERKDGTLYQLLRTETGWLYDSVSLDDGLKWEGLKQSPVKSVTCCAQMGRLSAGRVALLWNHPPRHLPESKTSREELSIALSDDGCRTWSKPVVIAARYDPSGRGRVSYPYLYERKPSELWITTMQGGLRMKINLADVHQGEIPIFKPATGATPKPGGIIMFGDSTTATRPGAVDKVYAQRVQETLKGLGSTLTVHNAGVGGNSTRDAKKRFESDVLRHKPRLIVMQFGLNDVSVDVWKTPAAVEPRVPLAEFESNLRAMIEQAQQQGAKVILMTTNPERWTNKLKDLYGRPPYRPDDPDGLDAPLAPYNKTVRKLAKELGVPLVDIHAAYPTFAAKHNLTVDQLLLDGVHPTDQGHQLVTELLVPVLQEQLR